MPARTLEIRLSGNPPIPRCYIMFELFFKPQKPSPGSVSWATPARICTSIFLLEGGSSACGSNGRGRVMSRTAPIPMVVVIRLDPLTAPWVAAAEVLPPGVLPQGALSPLWIWKSRSRRRTGRCARRRRSRRSALLLPREGPSLASRRGRRGFGWATWAPAAPHMPQASPRSGRLAALRSLSLSQRKDRYSFFFTYSALGLFP